jgi:hypothetical protein
MSGKSLARTQQDRLDNDPKLIENPEVAKGERGAITTIAPSRETGCHRGRSRRHSAPPHGKRTSLEQRDLAKDAI